MTDAPPTTRTERRRLLRRLRRAARDMELRERLTEVAYATVAAALALAFPAGAPYTSGGDAAARLAGDEDRITQGLLFPVASGFQALFEVQDGAEVVRLLAGLAFGGAVLATLVCLRRLGFRRSASLPATCAAFASAYAWRGSTSPIDYGLGLFGASLLLLVLCRTEQSMPRGYHWRAILAAGLAYMLHPEAVLLIPAVAVAVAWHPEYRGERAANLLAVLAVMGMSIAIGLAGGDEMTRVRHLASRALAGADDYTPRTLLAWIPEIALGLGLVLFGVYQLILAARAADTLRAPLWMVPWCLAALAPIIAGSPAGAPIAPFLVPAGALGLADWLNRRARGGRSPRLEAVGVVAAQAAILAVALALAR